MLRLLWRLITSSASCSSAFLSQRSNIAPALRLDSLTLGEFWRRSGSLDLATRVCFCSLMTKDIKADLLALVCQTGVLDQGVFPKLTLKDVYCLSCTCKSLQGLIMQHLPRLIKVCSADVSATHLQSLGDPNRILPAAARAWQARQRITCGAAAVSCTDVRPTMLNTIDRSGHHCLDLQYSACGRYLALALHLRNPDPLCSGDLIQVYKVAGLPAVGEPLQEVRQVQTGCFPEIAWSSTAPHLSVMSARHQWPGLNPARHGKSPAYIMDVESGRTLYSLGSATLAACGNLFKPDNYLNWQLRFCWSPSGRFLLAYEPPRAAPVWSRSRAQPKQLLIVDLHVDDVVLDTCLVHIRTEGKAPESLPVRWHPGSGSIVLSSQVQALLPSLVAGFPYAQLPAPCVLREHTVSRGCSLFSPDGRHLLVQMSRSDISLGICVVSSQAPLSYVLHRSYASIMEACWISDATLLVVWHRDCRPHYALDAITGLKTFTLDCDARHVSALPPASPFCSVLCSKDLSTNSEAHVIVDKFSGRRLLFDTSCSDLRIENMAWSPTGCSYVYCGIAFRGNSAEYVIRQVPFL